VGWFLVVVADGWGYRYAGIATHYVHSSSLPDLEARLSELVFDDRETLKERCKMVNGTIEEFVTGLPDDEPMELSGETREAIDR
jgi:3-hydroxyisobutyryl-CoA hydrolase